MKTKEEMEKEILEKIEEYFDTVHKEQAFFPGISIVNYAGRVLGADEMKAAVRSILDFNLTYGSNAIEFEKEFAKYLGITYAVLTNSGSSANLVAVSSLCSYKLENNLKPGDEVITPLCTFPTTLNPIIQNNLTPVLLDVEIGSYNMDLSLLGRALSKKTRAVMVPHTLGNPNDMNILTEFVKKNRLFLVEDCCDALDSLYDGKKMGLFGDMATFSFFPAHHMTMGEGGCVITSSPVLKTIAKSIRDWGRACWCEPGKSNTCGQRFEYEISGIKYDHKYLYDHIGYNLKPIDVQPAIGRVQLKRLPDFTMRRKVNFSRLYDFFAKYDRFLILPRWLDNAEPSWFAFPLTVRDNSPFTKQEIVGYLEKNLIETRPLFSGNVLEHPGYKNAKFKYRLIGDTKNADKILRDTFFIGVYPGLSEQKKSFMLKVCEDFLKRY